MANTLVTLQSIFSDQIKDRTRSHMRYRGVGYPAESKPEGSSGWEPLRQFTDRVENAFGYDEVENAVGRVVPDIRTDDISLPQSYQAWGRGYGSFVEQKTADGFTGYDATIGGGILGLDKQINNVLLGIAGGYARTVVDGYDHKDGTSDTGHAAVYFSVHGENAFLDANANYAFNDVETDYDTLGYTGEYDAHTVALYLGGGYGISIADRVLLTPEASILNTLYMRDAYTESSDLYPDLAWESYDQWSHLGVIGATLSSIHKLDLKNAEVAVEPELRAHLLHEFNDEFDDEKYMMVGGQYTVGASLKAREEDLVKVGAGVRISSWSSDTTEIGFDVDGTFGEDYNAYMVSGKIQHRF
jgi:outer membrane autotransporter protein